MAPCTRQQKRLGIRVTRAKAKTKEYRFSLSSSSSSSSSNSSKRRRRATTKKKQSPPPPPPPSNTPTTNDEKSKVAADHNISTADQSKLAADHNNSKMDGLRRFGPGWASYKKYFSVPKDLALKYSAQIKASDGFDVDNSLNGYRSMCGSRILPIEYEPGFSIDGDKDLHKCAKKALASFIYKNKNEKNLKFHRVVKANQRGGHEYWTYYITFEATDTDNQIKTLQTKVSQKFTGKQRIKIEFCRLKPIPTPTSAPEADDRLKPTPTPTSTSAPEADRVIL